MRDDGRIMCIACHAQDSVVNNIKDRFPSPAEMFDVSVSVPPLLIDTTTSMVAVVVSFFFTNWVQAIAFTIFNLVGLIQVCLALLKKDIRNVFLSTWCCQNHDETSTSTSKNKVSYLQVFSRRKSSNKSSVNDADQQEDEGRICENMA